jgi:hypothetical protein
MQKNTFVGEDLRSLEGIDLEGESEDPRDEEEGDDDAASGGDCGDHGEMEEDVPLAWGDVFVEDSNTDMAVSRAEEEEEDEWCGITPLPEQGPWACGHCHVC